MMIIPFNNSPSQAFELELEDSIWTFRLDYNSRDQHWSMGLDKDGASVAEGIKIVTGIDLMHGFNLMEGMLVAIASEENLRDPVIGDFGVNCDLYYFSAEDIASV